jgi:hypothetical protein
MSNDVGYLEFGTVRRWTLGLLSVQAIVAAIALWMDQVQREHLVQGTTLAAALANNGRLNEIHTLQLLLFIACAAAILLWVHRSCHNARVGSRSLRCTPAGSIGWYFVPVANFWMPYRAMREIWRATAEQAGNPADRAGLLLGVWWTLWILRSLAALQMQYGNQIGVETLDVLYALNTWNLWLDSLTLLLSLMFIVMVMRLTRLQRRAFGLPQSVASRA